MKYLHEPLEKAAKHCVEELRRDGGVGGVVALDNRGNGMSVINPDLQHKCTDPSYNSGNASQLFGNVQGRRARRRRPQDCDL